jgi:hypothetical protein
MRGTAQIAQALAQLVAVGIDSGAFIHKGLQFPH